MVIVTHQRDKCIGCYACVEVAYAYWRMNQTDGKSTLIESVNKKGFYTSKLSDDALNENKKAAESCPVKIIKVSQV